ncbi:hypothetical protein D8674_000172 [Pyrus ussuriensis x Pyrus communis]|uniref:Uncharacterized protein n=1 Tax=Pyrus ussuriensis x Pyrus communis TaxID=2448454 RepID=A0A5N5F7U5_9ROSA|nr:hypothetical protein D8674_000172 [Pyrus ussuriensis x Pyrus communis]
MLLPSPFSLLLISFSFSVQSPWMNKAEAMQALEHKDKQSAVTIHVCKAEANDDEFKECFDKRWKGPAVTLSVR